MLSILVINTKGGSGKTTLTTNIASFFASQKYRTAIMDYDAQGSSLHWLKTRPGDAEKIHGANAAPPKGTVIQRSVNTWLPDDTKVLVIDAPAGAKGLLLQELVRRSDYILIPVAPSPIDIHATADFIKDLFLVGGARTSKAKIAVVANRVRSGSTVYASLERFLHSLKLPFLTTISDSENYLHAIEKGLGIFEMDEAATVIERQELMPVMNWLTGITPNLQPSRSEGNVVNLDDTRKHRAYRTGTHEAWQTLPQHNRPGNR
ncbi:MAG: ParA family protein [Gallionellaceae bacterium]|nr:ParA family protein [Gallionellaceae bacterium]